MAVYLIEYRDDDFWELDPVEAPSLDEAVGQLDGCGYTIRYVAGPDVICRSCGQARRVSYDEMMVCDACRHPWLTAAEAA